MSILHTLFLMNRSRVSLCKLQYMKKESLKKKLGYAFHDVHFIILTASAGSVMFPGWLCDALISTSTLISFWRCSHSVHRISCIVEEPIYSTSTIQIGIPVTCTIHVYCIILDLDTVRPKVQ